MRWTAFSDWARFDAVCSKTAFPAEAGIHFANARSTDRWVPAFRRDCGEFWQEAYLKVTGRCHCGKISFEAEIDPGAVRICHCTDCQTLSGSAFRINVGSLPGTFVLKSGTPKIYVKTAESGNQRVHAFCPDCGTPIYATSPDPDPKSYGLRVGTLDCRAELRPARQGWFRSALPWSQDLTGVTRAERQ